MTIDAKMTDTNKMTVTFNGKVMVFDAYKSRVGFESDYVFSAPVVRGGKDWPVGVVIKEDGTASVYYPSGLQPCNSGSVRITGFWADSQNKSRHNKV